MNKKYYTEKGSEEYCYTLPHFIKKLQELDSNIILEEMEVEYGNGFFYCSETKEVGESQTGTCGQICSFYQPRNGKNGRCRFSNNTYVATGKFFNLSKENNKLSPI
ncbi:MAG: hypothetical protein M0R03_11460 [Novosphingobium sp.]|nr:hypothetical protein [Novosphingobium sp.]